MKELEEGQELVFLAIWKASRTKVRNVLRYGIQEEVREVLERRGNWMEPVYWGVRREMGVGGPW
jgi:hypothetical protein